jgi:hypothetical protein
MARKSVKVLQQSQSNGTAGYGYCVVEHRKSNGRTDRYRISWARFGKPNAKRIADTLAEDLENHQRYADNRIEDTLRAICGRLGIETSRSKWQPYEKAQQFVASLHLKSQREWVEYCKGKRADLPTKPLDIPRQANTVYKNHWISWPIWFGKINVKNDLQHYKRGNWMCFDEARNFVRQLELHSINDWIAYKNGEMSQLPPLPKNMPKNPQQVYMDKGWRNWRDFLGNSYLAFEEARTFVRQLGLQSSTEWKKYVTGKRQSEGFPPLPSNIPKRPRDHYQDAGWCGWRDWLGYNHLSRFDKHYSLASFEKARTFARSLGLQSFNEWLDYTQGKYQHLPPLPNTIPKYPQQQYRGKGWSGYKDFLGCQENRGRKRKKTASFEEARAFARALKLNSMEQWQDYVNGNRRDLPPLPAHMVKRPAERYAKEGWKGFMNFLGCRRRNLKPMLAYDEARLFVQQLGLTTQSQWRRYARRELTALPPLPDNIPRSPDKYYRDKGWQHWRHWLGTDHLVVCAAGSSNKHKGNQSAFTGKKTSSEIFHPKKSPVCPFQSIK